MLYAPFMAAVQIVLYAGGILVMFLFVMMLVNIEDLYIEKMLNKQWKVGLAASVIFGGNDDWGAVARSQNPSSANRQPS